VADINLTQEDAEVLLAMEKHKADDAVSNIRAWAVGFECRF
jgi:hypothetical protein